MIRACDGMTCVSGQSVLRGSLEVFDHTRDLRQDLMSPQSQELKFRKNKKREQAAGTIVALQQYHDLDHSLHQELH